MSVCTLMVFTVRPHQGLLVDSEERQDTSTNQKERLDRLEGLVKSLQTEILGTKHKLNDLAMAVCNQNTEPSFIKVRITEIPK